MKNVKKKHVNPLSRGTMAGASEANTHAPETRFGKKIRITGRFLRWR